MRSAAALVVPLLLLTAAGCSSQPTDATLLDERGTEEGIADDAERIKTDTTLGPPGSEVPVTISFVPVRDGCAAVGDLLVERDGGPEKLVLSNVTASRGDCGRSVRGNRGKPTTVRLDWNGWNGCQHMAANGDGFRVWPDGHVEAFMLSSEPL
jgi:hypothetical protein